MFNSITHFVKHATNTVLDFEKKDIKRTYRGAKSVYHAADRFGKREQEHVLGQLPGTNAFHRRQQHEQQANAAGHPIRNEQRLSPGAISEAAQEGMLLLDIPSKVAKSGGKLGHMIPGLFKGTTENVVGAKVRPNSFTKLRYGKGTTRGADIGWDNRTPMLTHQRTGAVIHGNKGDVHKHLFSTMARRNLKHVGVDADTNPGAYHHEIQKLKDEWMQGWVVNPYKGKLRIEFGHGPEVGIPAPKDLRGVKRAIDWLTQDFEDANITNRLNHEGGRAANNLTSKEIQDRALEQFLKDEKKFTHRPMEPAVGGKYDPKDVPWEDIKSGQDWKDWLGVQGDNPREFAFGARIGEHKQIRPTASGLARVVKGMAKNTEDIAKAKKWWGRKIGGAYPNEETLLEAYADNNALIAKRLEENYAARLAKQRAGAANRKQNRKIAFEANPKVVERALKLSDAELTAWARTVQPDRGRHLELDIDKIRKEWIKTYDKVDKAMRNMRKMGIVPEYMRPGKWESVDDTLLRINRHLSGYGYGEELQNISIKHLGFAPQSRDPALRLKVLAEYRAFAQSLGMNADTMKMFDRAFIPESTAKIVGKNLGVLGATIGAVKYQKRKKKYGRK